LSGSLRGKAFSFEPGTVCYSACYVDALLFHGSIGI